MITLSVLYLTVGIFYLLYVYVGKNPHLTLKDWMIAVELTMSLPFSSKARHDWWQDVRHMIMSITGRQPYGKEAEEELKQDEK